MKTYVLDANAIVRFFTRGNDFEKVKALFNKAAAGEITLTIPVFNWGEVLYSMAKRIGFDQAASDLKALGSFMNTIDADQVQAEAAARVKHNFKLGYGDSFAAELAMRLNATLVTADSDFEKLGKRIRQLRLRGHSQ